MSDEQGSRLFEDVKTADEFGGGELVLRGSGLPVEGLDPANVTAVEQGRRFRTNGDVEDYQRVEFR